MTAQDAWRAGLESPKLSVRAESLESLLLEQLSGPVETSAAAEAYQKLSMALLERRNGASGRYGAKELGVSETALNTVWALIYGARSFHLAQGLLQGLGPLGQTVELGSGWGPFALAAALKGAPVHLLDASKARLAFGHGLLQQLGLSHSVETGDLRQWKAAADTLILPYVVNEVYGRQKDVKGAVRQLTAWHAAGARQILIVEPGDQISVGFLGALREALIKAGLRVAAPCAQNGACPLRALPRQWCHFTWPSALGPVGRQIADLAARRWQELHFSYLCIGDRFTDRAPDAAPEQGRLLEVRRRGKPAVSLRVCTASGLADFVVLKRSGELFDKLRSLRPGSELAWRSDLPMKGDGYRVESEGDVWPVR